MLVCPGAFEFAVNLPAHQQFFLSPVMASKGKAPDTPARLRKRHDNGTPSSPSITSDNTQNDEHVAEIYQSPVSTLYFSYPNFC